MSSTKRREFLLRRVFVFLSFFFFRPSTEKRLVSDDLFNYTGTEASGCRTRPERLSTHRWRDEVITMATRNQKKPERKGKTCVSGSKKREKIRDGRIDDVLLNTTHPRRSRTSLNRPVCGRANPLANSIRGSMKEKRGIWPVGKDVGSRSFRIDFGE